MDSFDVDPDPTFSDDRSRGTIADGSPSAAPSTRRRRQADDWSLVLEAEGIAHSWQRENGGFSLVTADGDRDRASRIVAEWEEERSERQRRLVPRASREPTAIEVACAYALALLLIGWHARLVASGSLEAFSEIGASDAAKVLAGETERLVTALTLHSDWAHVAGNTLFGGLFLAILAGRLGVGVGALCFVATGAAGNFANVLYYGTQHVSVGASTGVFGLVGVLSGLAAWQRHQTAPPRRGAWVAFAAGLGIVAMLGTGGPRVDLSAHVFGLIAGTAAGIALALPLATRSDPPRPLVQIAALLISIACVGLAWRLAWGGPSRLTRRSMRRRGAPGPIAIQRRCDQTETQPRPGGAGGSR